MTDALRGGPVAGRQAHNLEGASSILAPATTLTPDEQAVLAELRRHRGRACAIGLDTLAILTSISERHVQQLVASLIEAHGLPIGSAVKKGTPVGIAPDSPRTTSSSKTVSIAG